MSAGQVVLLIACIAAAVLVYIFAPDKAEDLKTLLIAVCAFAGGVVVPTGGKKAAKMLLLTLGVSALLSAGGCVGGSSSLKANNVSVDGQPLSSAQMADDSMAATFQGAAPSITNLDDKGAYNIMQGPHAVLGFNAKTGAVYVLDPKNTQIGHIEYIPQPAPGQAALKIDNLNANMSDVVSVYAAQFKDAMVAMTGMTQEQAKVWIQTAQTAGTIIPQVADVLLKAFVPTLPTQ